MKNHLQSNRFLTASFCCACVTLCSCAMQDHAVTQYTSDTEGYERSVAENYNNKIAARLNAAANTIQSAANVPVVISNPYEINQGLGSNATAGVGMANSTYGSLNGVIQPGVFMQNNSPIYTPPASFGSNYYSPAR